MKRGPFDGSRVNVCAEMCATCIFRPGNLMDLRRGRVADMIHEAQAADSAITCHERLWNRRVKQAVCRGFYDHHRTAPLQIAERLDLITFL
jgi:hypothetical protein